MRVHTEMGHFGELRVHKFLQKAYWWEGMGADVKGVLRGCLSCARAKAPFKDP